MTDPTPPPGSYNWMLGEPLTHTVEVPVPGSNATLRVEITARARIYPSRGWAIAIIIWGLLVLLLLNRAHAASPWGNDWHSDRSAPAWGAQDPGRTTTYHPYQRQDGTTGRCAVYQWRNEPVMKCE